jgi:hypothetical protein
MHAREPSNPDRDDAEAAKARFGPPILSISRVFPHNATLKDPGAAAPQAEGRPP